MDLVEFKSEHIMVEELPKAVNGLAEHVESEKTHEERREFKRVLRKIDLTILPMLGIMSFMESMARGDVGNAAVLGMQRQLNITPQQLSHCISFFFIGYVVFQLPGMLFLRVLTPPAQLGFALMFWGTFVTLLCIAENYATIAGFRVLIGIGEAFMQAAPVYLTLWYKREQLALRIGILFSVAAIAGSFNGLISYGIYIDINGVHGWPAWKWLFFVQGIIAVGFGVVTFLFLPPVPEKLRWPFTQKEREIAIRMSKEAYNVPHASISPKQLYAVLKDPQSWYLAIIFGALNASLACFSGFLPVIIKSFGFSLLKTEILVIPVYVCVTISILIFAAISDHLRKRGLLLIMAFVIAATGWIMIIVSRSRSVSFAATFLAGMGTYPLVIISIAWVNTNVVGFTKRAGTFALMQTVGQSLAIGGTEIYSDPPHYYRGNGFALGACVVGIIATIGLLFHLRAKNTYKLQNQNTEEAARARALGIEEVWDDHPDFFYVL